MAKHRSVNDVINQILRVIPNSETQLIAEITNYSDSLWNQAPEALYTRQLWLPLIQILNDNIPQINSEWKTRLVNIVNDNHPHAGASSVP
jgi:hypothetical protein